MERLSVGLTTTLDGRSFLKLSGELDISTSELLTEQVGAFHGPVLVDCDELRFVDSGGFAALARLSKTADSFVLWRVTPELRQVLHIMNLGGAVSIL